jgi:signal transduction histidine kinase
MEELKDESLLGLAENINRGASNLNRRIDELLDLAKGEIGALQINPKPLDAVPLIGEIARSMITVGLRKQQCLSVELPAALSTVLADEDRLRQVLLNLLQNAFKFTPVGGKIILRAREDGANLIIEVEDTGRGISKQELKDIFEPYRQQKNKGTRISGLGLGLALSKRLIELHGGSIWVKSKKGKGSIFGFSVPLVAITKKGHSAKQV